ncbi:ArsR/SmtB family transcription factor [Agromyces archimandritae]|uniref:Helix-turn-helix domain-containing protein n=1 Tax=Agromyces archimandritae TaxID=2781962 RepID=A0A975IND8_9MICO|nr:helix-turn-helix domain-containing protein [Agromyces archimandritae]QTX04144.1 helix-turn-helix domain-containing protein [Agromyces archimandritae]
MSETREPPVDAARDAPASISDPARIRALAHPIRLALLEALRNHGELTATEAGEAVGESAASCSFHLRMLEKYGYIERAEPRGREKPWRIRESFWATEPDLAEHDGLASSAALGEAMIDHEARRARAWLQDQLAVTDVDERRVQAAMMTTADFWATDDELAELKADLLAILERFEERTDRPETRPDGARRAHLFAVLQPDSISGTAPAE